jgi:seryl-tRNA synthetase
MQLSFTVKNIDNEEMRSLIDTQIRYLLPSNTEVSFETNNVVITSDVNFSEALQLELQSFLDKTIASYRKVNVLRSHAVEQKTLFKQNPMPELVSTGQVIETSPGIFSYAGELFELMQSLDFFFKEYALTLGATERLYPNILPIDSMIQNGYVSGFPHHALFISMAHQDSETLKKVAETKAFPDLNDVVTPNGLMLAPTVCHHCFEELKNTDIKENLMITSLGKCHRFEGPSAQDLSRTHIFNMREIVLFGRPSWVHKTRLAIKTFSEEVFNNWQLAYAVETATDPFFPAGSQKKRHFQAMNQTKFEIKLTLPFKSQGISAVSVNNHMSTLTDSYAITGEKGLISSCVGFGLERLAFAILSQFGLDRSAWPSSLKNDLRL